MEKFAYVLYAGFHAQRNLFDKQNVLFYGPSRNNIYHKKVMIGRLEMRSKIEPTPTIFDSDQPIRFYLYPFDRNT